ncbi:MAG: periplasmic heavy metal sensor, partial [Acidobacteriales bacterium]|nr:periplasmic heavy metal sensor [Terriglobales bacterium]
FQQNRPRLQTLRGNLEGAENALEPMISADQPDEAQVLAQVGQVAQARAELEKQMAHMLLDWRRNLTPEQWKLLREMHAEHMHHGPPPPQ